MFFLVDGGGQHIGPFKNHDAVARFIEMMTLSGDGWLVNQIVEEGGSAVDASERETSERDFPHDLSDSTSKLKLAERKPGSLQRSPKP
jgi:hypothetical protein